MTTTTEKACIYSTPVHALAEHIQEGRLCTMTHEYCWNWNKPEAIMECGIFKRQQRVEAQLDVKVLETTQG